MQDLINIAREMGISKKELLEDYYFDEIILLMKRQGIMNQRRQERLEKEPGEEPTQEVYWDQFGI